MGVVGVLVVVVEEEDDDDEEELSCALIVCVRAKKNKVKAVWKKRYVIKCFIGISFISFETTNRPHKM